jgi:hypothetical protein
MSKNEISVFGRKVFTAQCPESLFYSNKAIQTSINEILSLPEVKNRKRGHKWDIHLGKVDCSEVAQYITLESISGIEDLLSWIKSECTSTVNNILNVDSAEISIDRYSINRMYFGSEGLCHNHSGIYVNVIDKPAIIVGIFYISNPPGGSNLVFINNGEFKKQLSEFQEEDKLEIVSTPGMLVLHDPELWHVISTHNSVDPRTCLAFQISV